MEYRGKGLTIAGSDSGGGAGIQADLKTFQAFNIFGMSVITSVTSQNTKGVRSIQNIKPDIVKDQIDMIMEDMGCDAAKTGMVSTAEIIEVIVDSVEKHGINKIVVDPVMVSKSGERLLQKDAENTLIEYLLPVSYLLTPNIHEAEIITGMKIKDIEDCKKAARKISEMGASNVLIKGGHLDKDNVTDIFYDGKKFTELSGRRIESRNTHGTGCTLSSAITASLAAGENVTNSVKIAKDFITRAIKNAPEIGDGYGPLYHSIEPKKISAFETEARDFDFWFSKNETVFESELLAEKELFPATDNAVEIGVGSGLFASRLGIKKGVEPSEEMAELARKRGIDVKLGTAEDVPYPDETFDAVLLSTVLSYADNPQKALLEAYRILKKDGLVVVSFLPREGSYTMLYDLAKIQDKFDSERAPEYPYPVKFIEGADWLSVNRVKKLLKNAGFVDFEYAQTLTFHPKYTNENIEKPSEGYKRGDFVVIRARKK